jgi:hypothetical protein
MRWCALLGLAAAPSPERLALHGTNSTLASPERRAQTNSIPVSGEFIDDDVTLGYVDREGNSEYAYAAGDQDLVTIFAGVEMTRFEVSIVSPSGSPNYFFSFREGEVQRFKIIRAETTDPEDPTPELEREDAQDGACDAGSPHVVTGNVVSPPWSTDAGARAGFDPELDSFALLRAETEAGQLANLEFKMGGEFKLCYSSDGSFTDGKVDIPKPKMIVTGVYSDCTGDDCLAQKRYNCYALQQKRNANNSCVLEYGGSGSGYVGDVGKLSWSSDINATFDDDGIVTEVQTATCKVEPTCEVDACFPSRVLCDTSAECDNSGKRILDLSDKADKDIMRSLPQTVGTLSGSRFRPHTMNICYCPAYGDSTGTGLPCDSAAEFRQGVGVLHIWTARVCLTNDKTCDVKSYEGVVPQTPFLVKVGCPLDVCPNNNASRLKIVDVDRSIAELPSWHASHHCKTLPQTTKMLHACSAMAHEPGSGTRLLGGHDACDLMGGMRQDYKLFGETNRTGGTGDANFKPMIGESPHARLNFRARKDFDFCFCEGGADCEGDDGFFKVGEMSVTPFRPIPSLNATYPFVEYMNRPGILGFARAPADYLTSGMQEDGILKLLRAPDPDAPSGSEGYKVLTDEDCGSEDWDTTLVPDLTEATTWTKFKGTLQVMEEGVLGFNHIDNATWPGSKFIPPSTLSFTRPGLIAVCYCTQVEFRSSFNPDGSYDLNEFASCKAPEFWTLALFTTVKGASPGHRWEFSTNVIFRLDVRGWGLTSDHSIRVLMPGGEPGQDPCLENDGNPVRVETTMYKGCPGGCSAFSATAGNEPNIGLKVPAWDAVGCDEMNQDCELSYIRKVEPCLPLNPYCGPEDMGGKASILEFTSAPGLKSGDRIVLTENFACEEPAGSDMCPDMLDAVRGKFDFAPTTERNPAYPTQYVVGHVVHATEDAAKFKIFFGSANPDIRIVVVEDGSDFGKWTGLSNAKTAQELKGIRAKIDMPVCWSFSGNGGYSGTLGYLTLADPSVMEQPIVALSSRVIGSRAPMIISFKTAVATVGERYTIKTDEPMLLRLHFLNRNILDVYLSDLEASDLEARNLGEDELSEASQYICGKLFKEFWSSDKKNGFPLPKGCFFTTVGRQRDLMMVFEPMNGLNPGHSYQIVVNGAGKTGIEKDGEYLQVFTMDRVYTKPYTAIELGRTQLLRVPILPAGAADPQFQDPEGFKIINAGGGVVDMASSPMTFVLKGHETEMAAIVGRSVFRIFLWPFTQWETPSCDVVCFGYNDQSCGEPVSCKTEPVGVYGQQNLLIWEMPADLPPASGDVVHTFEVTGLNLPFGGFFPGRLAAEVSRPGSDTKPHYMLSSGGYLMKLPDEGYTVAKLLSFPGDGNSDPFRASEMNVLYLRIILAATLYGGGSAYPIASFTVTMPEGYQVISMSEADKDLKFFETRPPGRGTLGTPDNWDCRVPGTEVNGRQCTYSIKSHEILYAGSAIMIRAAVKNPPNAIPEREVTNAWTLVTNSKGMNFASPDGYTTPTVQFFATEVEYSNAVAVLGQLTEYSIQSSNPVVSLPSLPEVSTLSIFFHIGVTTMLGARILVHAPTGYSFGRLCRVSELPGAYFATKKGEVHPLPEVVRCIGHVSELTRPSLVEVQVRDDESTPTNQAVIDTRLRLLADKSYGFGVQVTNPLRNIPPEENLWYVWTLTPKGEYVAGTPSWIPTDPVTHDKLQLYHRGLRSIDEPSRDGIVHFNIRVADMTPMVLTGGPTIITVHLETPVLTDGTTEVTSPLRFAAPVGFEFRPHYFKFCSDAVFANSTCKALFNISGLEIPGLTAHFPPTACDTCSRFPHVDSMGHYLLFDPATYKAQEKYGFSVAASIPQYNPLSSWNYFTLEFGAHEPGGGAFFGRMQAPRVNSVTSFSVNSQSTVEGQPTNATVRFRLVQDIPPGGGLVLTLPERYQIFGQAEAPTEPLFYAMNPIAVDSTMPIETFTAGADLTAPIENVVEVVQSPLLAAQRAVKEAENKMRGSMLPLDTACRFDRFASGLPKIECTAGAGGLVDSRTGYFPNPSPPGIPAGLYSFLVGIQNPNAARKNEPDPSPQSVCGFLDCWVLQTREDMTVDVDLDTNATVPSYDVAVRMYMAYIVQVGNHKTNDGFIDTRIATKRNDRPGRENNVIIAFTLAQDVVQSLVMRIEAPLGTVFDENCFFGLEYREKNVFGEDVPLPDQFMPWDSESAIEGCRALDNVAEINIRKGLKKESSYAFRIRLLQNAAATPFVNVWQIRYNEEESLPFEGFPLWMSKGTRVLPATTAKNLNEEEAMGLGLSELDTPNPVTVFFTPSQTVSRMRPPNSGALLRLDAPKTYRFQEPCDVQIVQEETWVEEQGQDTVYYPFEVWRGSDLSCFNREQSVLDVRINIPEKEMLAGHKYRLIATVLNPSVVQDYEGSWNLQTFSEDMPSYEAGLDEVVMQGFRVNRVMALWQYRHLDEHGHPQVYGRMPVNGLLFLMRFPDRLDVGDTVLIQAPTGFNLHDQDAEPDADGLYPCNGFRWQSDTGRVYVSVPKCKANRMKLVCTEDRPINPMEQIKILIDTVNPQVTPLLAENFWSAGHFRVDPVGGQISTMSSHTARSWSIVSQLEQVRVVMQGPDYGASGMGSLLISFLPMSSANRVLFASSQPPGWDYRSAGLILTGQEIINVEKESVLMRMIVNPLEESKIAIVNIKLGYPGGQTVFDITTYMETVKVDEKINFNTGFVLPGTVHLAEASVKSEYAMNPIKFPLESQWSVQLSSYIMASYQQNTQDPLAPRPKRARATFAMSFSRDALENSTFFLQTSPFQVPQGAKFRLGFAKSDAHPDGEEIVLEDYHVKTSEQVSREGNLVKRLKLRDSISGRLSTHISAFEPLTMVVDVISPDASVVEEKRRDGLPRWKSGWLIKTTNDQIPCKEGVQCLPSNTNDAHFDDFKLVRELGFKIHPGRCLTCRRHAPPGAIIHVALQIEAFETEPNELYVSAPRGFKFTEDCLSTAPSEIRGCTHVEDNKGHDTVRVDVPKGLAPEPKEFVLEVLTPDGTPGNPSWYVQAINSLTLERAAQVAWAKHEEGFEVLQMQSSSVVLPTIPGYRVPVAFGFRSRDRLEKRAVLTVHLPPNYIPMCEHFVQLSFPGEPGCKVTQTSPPHLETLMYTMTIEVNQTLVPSDYSFMVSVVLPVMTPPDHHFSMVLTDLDNVVKDAAMGMNVPRMVFGFPVTAHPHPYHEQQPGCVRYCQTRKLVTVVFSVDDLVKEDIKIKHIMLRFPDSVVHEVVMKEGAGRASGLEMVSQSFESTEIYPQLVSQFGWDVGEADQRLQLGEYDMSLPITIPEYDPGYNVWTLHFCRFSGERRCISRADPPDDKFRNDDPENPDSTEVPKTRRRRVMLAIPIKGFGLTDESPIRDTGQAWAPRPLLFAVAALATFLAS